MPNTRTLGSTWALTQASAAPVDYPLPEAPPRRGRGGWMALGTVVAVVALWAGLWALTQNGKGTR
jgi:hypothetical protein